MQLNIANYFFGKNMSEIVRKRENLTKIVKCDISLYEFILFLWFFFKCQIFVKNFDKVLITFINLI